MKLLQNLIETSKNTKNIFTGFKTNIIIYIFTPKGLIHMKIAPISSNLNYSRIDYRKENKKQTVNTSATLPSFADAKSFVNMSFKAAIHNYAENGDLEGLKRELDKGESVNARDWNGFMPLMVAGHSGRINTFNELLKHPDIDINAQPNKMDTALIRVSRNGYAEMVKKLVERPEIDVNIQRKDDGETALIAACFAAKEQAVNELLKHPDIDVNLQNKDGLTALIYACRYGSPKIVEALLKMPDINVNLKDKSGNTALIWAVTNKRPEIVKQLINHPDIDVNARDKDGNTALNRASYSNRINEVKELLKHPDIDISIEDCYSGTALYYAKDKKHSEIEKMIEDYVPGVDRREGVNQTRSSRPVSDINAKDEYGNTALIRACTERNDIEAVKELLQNPDIDINAKDFGGNTAFAWAAYSGSVDLVRLLISHPDIDVNIQNNVGITPLIKAALQNNEEIVKEILRHPDVKVNIKDVNGYDAAHWGKAKIAKMIEDYIPGVDRREGIMQKSTTRTDITINSLSPEENIFSEEEITKKFLSLLKTKQLESAEKMMKDTPLINLTANNNEILNTACTTGSYDFVMKLTDYKNSQPQKREEYDAQRKDFLENKIKTLSYEELKENPVALHTEDGFKILMEREEFNPNDIVDKKSLFDYACKIDTKGEIAKQILSKYDDINIDNAKRNGSTEIKALAYFYENVGKYQVKFDKIKRNIANPETRSLGAEQLKEFMNSSDFKPDMTDSLGNSTLHIAASMSDDSARGLIDRLITKGVKLDSKNITNQNALISAIKAFRIATTEEDKTKLLSNIKFLLDKGLDVNEPDSNGQTAFHHACSTTSVGLLSLVLSKEPNVFTKDKLGHKGSYYLQNQQMKDVLDNYINN